MNTGWGEAGAGEYLIRLRVRDISPHPSSPALWSEWVEKPLTVVLPLTGSGEITPNPALSGFRVNIAVETDGYADEVTIRFPNDGFFKNQAVSLSPTRPISSRDNTWTGTFLTDKKTPDGLYTAVATIRRTEFAPETITVPIEFAIQGNIYDQIRIRIREIR